jgi:hypothetical protein
MASAADRLKFILEVDPTGAVKGFQSIGNAAEKELGKAESKLDKVGANMTKFGAGAMAFAGVAFAGFTKLADGASDLNESLNAVDVTFGAASDGILQLSEDAAKAAGLSRKEFNGLAVQFASFAKTVAGDGGDVVSTVDEMTRRAADFASVMNLEVAEAARIFQSSLAGETEPIKKFGIDLSAAAVGAYAVANGISASANSMTEAEKVTARYGLLMESTAHMQDDFVNTSDGLANSQRILKAELENLRDEIGAGLLPIFQQVTSMVGNVVGAFSSLSPEVKTGIGTFAGLATAALGAAGALSFTAGQFIKHRERFRTMFTTVDNGTRSLTTLGKAMGAVGVAVAAATVVLSVHNAKQKESEERSKAIAGALRAENAERGEQLDLLAQSDEKVAVFVNALADLGLTTDDVNQFLADGTGELARMLAQLERISRLDATEQIKALQRELGLSQEEAAAYRLALLRLKPEIDELVDTEADRVAISADVAAVTGDITTATEDEADATKSAADSIKDKVAALRDSAQAYEESKQKIEDFIDAQRAAFDATFALERATWDAEDALMEYGKVVGDTESSEQAKIEAQREAEQAILDLAFQTAQSASDINVANGGIAFSAEEMAARQVSALDGIIAYLGPDDPLRKRLEEYRQALMDIPAVRDTKIQLDTAEADRELQQFRNRTGQPITVPVVTQINGQRVITNQQREGFAKGTSFAPGGVALVGEEGPELVELPAGARVHTANQTARMANGTRGVSSGGALTINVTALDPQQAADAVIDAIRQYERRNGPGWRS